MDLDPCTPTVASSAVAAGSDETAERAAPDRAPLPGAAVLFEDFAVPRFLGPYLDRFFEPADVDLARALSAGPLEEEELGRRLPAMDPAEIVRAHRRGMVDRRADGTVALADFHARFEIWAVFEGWKDVPAEIRAALNHWEQERYLERKRPQIEALRAGRTPDPHLENSEYLLLHEAEALLGKVERIYLWPCNCRAMMGVCSKPVNTCLRFSDERGVGWEISRERALSIVREANRAGLMQTGEVAEVDGRITGALCNCCADCCYPHLVSSRLGAEKLWPLSRYVARRLEAVCTGCGRCARRCPFGAFTATEEGGAAGADGVAGAGHAAGAGCAAGGRDGDGGSARAGAGRFLIGFAADLCRGCGVCATACPAEAIVMDPVPGPVAAAGGAS